MRCVLRIIAIASTFIVMMLLHKFMNIKKGSAYYRRQLPVEKNLAIRLIKCQEGFNLVELMVAMVIAVLVLVGFVGANGALRQTSESMYEKSTALQDANQVIELMRSAAASGTFPANVTASYPNGGTVSGFSNLTNETVTVSYANATANPLNTTVTVSWLQNGRRSVSTTLRTYITQRS